MIATDKPERPGKDINRYSTPETPHIARINKKPCKNVSILKAAMNANRINVAVRIFINMYKDAFSMLS